MADEFEENFMEDEGDLLEVIQEEQDEPVEQETTENQENESQNDDETKRIVKPKKRLTRPQIKLDATRLIGPRGISILESTFKDIQFKGKGHELEDLNKVLRTLEHWGLRLFPRMSFDDIINKIEDLGFKKNVMVNVKKIRLGMEEPEIPTVPETIIDDEVVDPFDELISNVPKPTQPPPLTEEQRARMMRNRLIAEEIRMKKMQARQKENTKEASGSELTITNDSTNCLADANGGLE